MTHFSWPIDGSIVGLYLLVACCYWRRANNWGAGAAIVVGAAIPVTFLVMQKVPATQGLAKAIGPDYSKIGAFVLAVVAMAAGSLLKPGGAREQTTTEAGHQAEAAR